THALTKCLRPERRFWKRHDESDDAALSVRSQTAASGHATSSSSSSDDNCARKNFNHGHQRKTASYYFANRGSDAASSRNCQGVGQRTEEASQVSRLWKN